MKIVKLTDEHVNAVKPLFEKTRYMGIAAETKNFIHDDKEFSDFFHEAFVSTYLSGLKNYHAFGLINNENIVQSYIGFYESTDDASWYWNHIRSLGGNNLKDVLDEVLKYNEKNGLYKFYSMFPLRYKNTYRRLMFSASNAERYDYFDEFFVKERNQCLFTLPWQILYNRTLVPVETVVRCTFLKQEYRKILFDGGNL